MNAEQAWQATLGQLQLDMPKASFDTWMSEAQLVGYEDGSFVIGVNNAYARDWLESRLASTVKRLLTGIMNRTVQVRFIVWQKYQKTLEQRNIEFEPGESVNLPASAPGTSSSISPRYSFETFVVGARNRLAHAAALAVA